MDNQIKAAASALFNACKDAQDALYTRVGSADELADRPFAAFGDDKFVVDHDEFARLETIMSFCVKVDAEYSEAAS